jgi:hypothetical protein
VAEVIALEVRSRKTAGFAVYLGFAPAVLEHVDSDPRKPTILLDACGEPLSVFRTKSGAQAAIRRTRELAPKYGYEDRANYRVVPLRYA